MFVKFSCGCVGLRIAVDESGSDSLFVGIRSCDADVHDDPLHFYLSDRAKGKPYGPLPLADQKDLIRQLGAVVADGYRLRTIQSLLAPRGKS